VMIILMNLLTSFKKANRKKTAKNAACSA